MGKERQLVSRFHYADGTAQCQLGFVFRTHCRAGTTRGLRHVRHDRLGRQPGMKAIVPFQRQRSNALVRGSHVVGYDSSAVVQPHYLAHAADLHRSRFVEPDQPATAYRRDRQRRHFHAGQDHVDTVACRAIQLAFRIETLCRRADQAELACRLQYDVPIRGQRHAPRRLRQLPISQQAPAGCMEDGSLLRATSGRVDLPLAGCRTHEKDARRGAGLAHRHPCRTHRRRAPGHLATQCRIAVLACVSRCMLQHHLVEIDLELLGDQHRDRRVRTLSHLDVRHRERDRAVGTDPDERIGRERDFRWQGAGHAAGNGDLQQQPTCGRSPGFKPQAPGCIRKRAGHCPPHTWRHCAGQIVAWRYRTARVVMLGSNS
jgi:hypothetical protein